MRRFSSIAAVGSIVLSTLLLLISPLAAEAHESRAIADGKYQIVVGFIGEPVFAGDKSGLEFFVSDLSQATSVAGEQAAEGVPVEGLEETLNAEVIFGDQTMELPLTARFNTPGAYQSVFFPMKPGDYTFRIYGTLDGTDVDESFTSSPEGFGSVQDPAPLRFPK
jgi:hypothetical protein